MSLSTKYQLFVPNTQYNLYINILEMENKKIRGKCQTFTHAYRNSSRYNMENVEYGGENQPLS